MNNSGKHIFSDGYNDRKERLLSSLDGCEVKETYGVHRPRVRAGVLAAALAVVLALSVSAAVAVARMNMTKEGGKTTIIAEKVDGEDLDKHKWDMTEDETAVKLYFDWMPDDMTKNETEAHSFGSVENGRWMEFYVCDLRQNELDDIITDTVDAEEFTAGGHQGYVVRRSETHSENCLYVMLEEDLVIYGCFGKGIMDEELTKIVEGMTLTETSDVYAVVPLYPSVTLMWNGKTESYPTDYLTAGEVFRNIRDGYTLSVDSVSVAYDVKALDPEDCKMDVINEFTDGQGNFIEYDRAEVVYGNGEDKISHYGERSKSKKMLVTADFTYTNTRKEKDKIYAFDTSLRYIGSKTYYRVDNEYAPRIGYYGYLNTPVYISCMSESGAEDLFDILVDAGETVHFTLGWLIDEDLFESGAAIVVHGCRNTTIAYYKLVSFDIEK